MTIPDPLSDIDKTSKASAQAADEANAAVERVQEFLKRRGVTVNVTVVGSRSGTDYRIDADDFKTFGIDSSYVQASEHVRLALSLSRHRGQPTISVEAAICGNADHEDAWISVHGQPWTGTNRHWRMRAITLLPRLVKQIALEHGAYNAHRNKQAKRAVGEVNDLLKRFDSLATDDE